MSNNNFTVSIIVIGNINTLEHRLNKKIINIYYLNKKRSAYSIFKIRKVIKEINPDYIFSSISHLNLIALICKKLFFFKSKIIIRETTNLKIKYSRKNIENYFFKILIKILYNSADLIIVPSNEIRNNLIDQFHIFNNKLFILNNPLDTNYIEYLSNQKSELHYFTKNFLNKKIAICIGRLSPVKKLIKIIDIFSKFLQTNNHWILIIIGHGEQSKELSLLIQKKKLKKNILIFDNLPNHFVFYKISNLFVQYSEREGLSNSLLEALYFEVPVVISNVSEGQNALLKHLNCGLVVSNDNELLNSFNLANLNKIPKSDRNMVINLYESSKITKKFINRLNNL